MSEIIKADIYKLDNPAFYSLSETHSNFALNFHGMKFYNPMYCPFGGWKADLCIDTEQGITNYAQQTSSFYVIGQKPIFGDNIILSKELICDQILLESPLNIEINEEIIEIRTDNERNELYQLVNFVQPGYFRDKTPQLGNYYGIYKNDRLVAVTGERMKMDKFTEISAVVIHPDHIGRGYAKQLVSFASKKIFMEGRGPYLHVAESNFQAIALYIKLGFKTRRKMSFWGFERK